MTGQETKPLPSADDEVAVARFWREILAPTPQPSRPSRPSTPQQVADAVVEAQDALDQLAECGRPDPAP